MIPFCNGPNNDNSRKVRKRRDSAADEFIPLGCDVNDEKNLPLVGAEVNVFAARILHTSSKQKAIIRLPLASAKSEAAASTLQESGTTAS